MEYPTKLEDVIEMVRKEKQIFCELVDQAEELEHEAIGLAKAISLLNKEIGNIEKKFGKDAYRIHCYHSGLEFSIAILNSKRDEAIKDLNQCNASIELTSAEVENLEDLQSEIEYSLEGDDPEDDGE